METFLWSLLLAAISAITFIAYKHHASFRKRVAPALLVLVIGAACFSTGVFSGSVSALSEALNNEAALPQLDKRSISFIAKELATASSTHDRALIICAITFSYVILLVFLPLLLDLSHNGEREGGV